MFPALLAFVALYVTFVAVGDVLPAFGINTSAGLIVAYLGGAMGANVWLLKGYFDTVPRELDEAAKVDGASHARIFFTMTLRLVMPILVTVFMLSFVGLFGEFLLASIFLRDVDSQTLGVGLWSMMNVTGDRNKYFGPFCAGAMLASLPVVLLYLGFQKQLVGGLTQGSVK
jgi:arabinogalactan oligomer/maltooligosaccharide transport system permease protein